MGLTKTLLDEINYNDYIYDIEYEEHCYFASTDQVDEKKKTLEQVCVKATHFKARNIKITHGLRVRQNNKERILGQARGFCKKVIYKRNVFHKK